MSLKASWSCLNTLFCKNKCISSNNICKVFFLYLIESCVIQLFVHHAESASEMQRYMYLKFTFMHTPEVCSLYPPKLFFYERGQSTCHPCPVTCCSFSTLATLRSLFLMFVTIYYILADCFLLSTYCNSIQKRNRQSYIYELRNHHMSF